MTQVLPPRPPPRRAWPAGAGVLALLVTLGVAPLPITRAQPVKPWIPPGADSVVHWAAEARVAFQSNTGDSIGGANYRAYERVGNIGRRLLRSIGRQNMVQARAIEALLDSLGLDTDIVVDPELPYFVLLMVRNPFRLESRAVGYLYWFLGEDLRMQGAQFSGGHRAQARVWWTGNQEAPYAWGVADFTRAESQMHFTLFRLNRAGTFWVIAQYEDSGYKVGNGSVSWSDVNGDLKPELTAWIPGVQDSMFEECSGCPKLINELLFVERPRGFKLMDTRMVPTPYSTFTAFVRLLADGNRSAASRLLKDPAMVEKAVKAGWNTRRNHLWKLESVETGTDWPEWLVLRQRVSPPRTYRVNFEMLRGRWVIRDWTDATPAGGGAAPPARGKP